MIICIFINVIGILAAVTNLSCEQLEGNICIQCSWNPPFSLTPIQQYVIIFAKEHVLLVSSINTTVTRCFKLCGQYNISVAANNSAGMGSRMYETVDLIPNCKTIIKPSFSHAVLTMYAST